MAISPLTGDHTITIKCPLTLLYLCVSTWLQYMTHSMCLCSQTYRTIRKKKKSLNKWKFLWDQRPLEEMTSSAHRGNRKTEQTVIPNQCSVWQLLWEKPTPHCGRWSGSNHPGSCNYWGHCFPSGSGICKDKEVLITLSGNSTKSHLRVKYTHNKCDLIINELTALFIFLGSSFICVFFSTLLPPGPPSTEENSNIYLTQPIQLGARLSRTRPVAASFSAANTLLSRLKQLFSYV